MKVDLLSLLSSTSASPSKAAAESGAVGLFAGLLSTVESEGDSVSPLPQPPTMLTSLPDEAVPSETSKNLDPKESANKEDFEESTPVDWPSWATFSSIAQPADPRGVSVNGSEGPTSRVVSTLTAREPGSRAWGLRLDSTRPGGAGVENERFQAHGMSSGSRGFRPELAGPLLPSAQEPVEAPPPLGQDRPRTTAPPPAPTPVAVSSDSAVVLDSAAPVATADSSVDIEVERSETSASSVGEPASQERESGSGDPRDAGRHRPAALSTPESLVSSSTGPVPDVPFAEAQPQSNASTSSPESAAQSVAPETEAEVPLPPASTQDGPVRVQVDEGLTLEVHSDDGVIDVVVEGDEAAVESVRDLGPTLEEDLDQHGWSLGDFGQRQRDDEREALLHRGPGRSRPGVATDEPPEAVAATRSPGRGKLVNVIA